MPTCRECEITQVTIEMRRAKGGTWLCKDKQACKARKQAKKEAKK